MNSRFIQPILVALSLSGCAAQGAGRAPEGAPSSPAVVETADAPRQGEQVTPDSSERWNSLSLYDRVSALAEREPKTALPGPPPPDILPFELTFEGRVGNTEPLTLGLVYMPSSRGNLIELGTAQYATNDSSPALRYTELVLWDVPVSGPRTPLGSVRLGAADLARLNNALPRRGGTLTILHIPLTIDPASAIPTYVAAEWRCLFRRRATPQQPTAGPWLYGAYTPVVRTN